MTTFNRKRRELKTILTIGVPLVTFVLGGFYLLTTFIQTQMEIKDERVKSISKRKFDLEEEHKKLMAKLDIDNFKLSRIPRPEENEKNNSKLNKK